MQKKILGRYIQVFSFISGTIVPCTDLNVWTRNANRLTGSPQQMFQVNCAGQHIKLDAVKCIFALALICQHDKQLSLSSRVAKLHSCSGQEASHNFSWMVKHSESKNNVMVDHPLPFWCLQGVEQEVMRWVKDERTEMMEKQLGIC